MVWCLITRTLSFTITYLGSTCAVSVRDMPIWREDFSSALQSRDLWVGHDRFLHNPQLFIIHYLPTEHNDIFKPWLCPIHMY
jgi:hypothetical protein